MNDTTDRRAAFLDGKLLQLKNKRAALNEELHLVHGQLDKMQSRFFAGTYADAMISALRHRINRLPVMMESVDREIRQAEADIDRHHHWRAPRD